MCFVGTTRAAVTSTSVGLICSFPVAAIERKDKKALLPAQGPGKLVIMAAFMQGFEAVDSLLIKLLVSPVSSPLLASVSPRPE